MARGVGTFSSNCLKNMRVDSTNVMKISDKDFKKGHNLVTPETHRSYFM